MKHLEARKLKGFRDYEPKLQKMRDQCSQIILREAALAGFQSIDTPAIEFAETLLGNAGEETAKEVYKFVDHGERAVALRFDLTVPFARYVAEHQGTMVFPFKRVQIGDVWRGEKPQKGRYRQFRQCDLDIIGADSVASDLEIILAFARILSALPIPEFVMQIGSRPVLSALVRKFAPGADENAALIAIDKLAKIGAEKVSALLVAGGFGEKQASEFLSLLSAHAESGDLGAIEAALPADPEVARIKELGAALIKFWRGRGTFQLNLSIARGLGYYTGVVFETFFKHDLKSGSICSGGRYNDLVSRFGGRELAGVGASIGLDRIVGLLEEEQKDAPRSGVFVAHASLENHHYSIGLALNLRDQGIASDFALQPSKLAKQFAHADRMGFRFVVTVGDDEERAQKLSVKELATGAEQRMISLTDALAVFKTPSA